MKKVFSDYLSQGSFSGAVPPPNADQSFSTTESYKTTQEKAAPEVPPTVVGPRSKSDELLHDAPSKDVPQPPPPSPQPPQQVETTGSNIVNQDPDAQAKEPSASHPGKPPSPDASLQHLRLSSNQVPISPNITRQAARSQRIFGVPVWWSPAHSADTPQRLTSEMESIPSTVPLGQYSETKADNLARRLCPVYKRDSRRQGWRSRWWFRYGLLAALVILCLTVLLLVALLAVLMRRSGARHLGDANSELDHSSTTGMLNTTAA